MFIFLLSFLSFILLSKSLSIKLLVPWAIELRFLSLCFWKQLSSSCLLLLKRSNTMFAALLDQKSFKKRALAYKLVEDDDVNQSILDLPELALECIFEMLPPSALCNMAAVCTSLRQRCTSDHLWEKHMKMKWGRVIHHAAYPQWQCQCQCQIACTNHFNFNFYQNIPKPLLKSLSLIWPLSWITSNHHHNSNKLQTCSPPHNSLMSWYLALDTGKFWFPAQVYNREHGHAGFMLSCYDAELCYNRCTDTFQARYPPHGRRTIIIEEGVQWDRLRAPPIDTPPHDLHISDCLNDLHPGDHIEIQWRRSKEFPYGWWYGIVGHLESCHGNENHCRCHNRDTVILEFNQYAPGSRWRRTVINRKDHWEEGNEADGFYGGIRKLHKMEEITMWKRLWPTESLE